MLDLPRSPCPGDAELHGAQTLLSLCAVWFRHAEQNFRSEILSVFVFLFFVVV
jgi:hypothetical protein